jgi:DNA-binding MarR family transcriptional regulator
VTEEGCPVGLVTIKPSPSDGRSRLIELTGKGSRLHDKAAPPWQEAQRLFAQLNGPERVTALHRKLGEMKVGNSEHSIERMYRRCNPGSWKSM